MIHLTRINGTGFLVNSALIEHVDMTPDTIVSMTTGQKFVVQETMDEIRRRVLRYQRAIHAPDSFLVMPPPEATAGRDGPRRMREADAEMEADLGG